MTWEIIPWSTLGETHYVPLGISKCTLAAECSKKSCGRKTSLTLLRILQIYPIAKSTLFMLYGTHFRDSFII